jgi:hypothetical protein
MISLKSPQRQPLDVKGLLSHHSFHHLKVPSMPYNLDNDWGRHLRNLKFAFSRPHLVNDLLFEFMKFLDLLSLRLLAYEHVKAWLLLEVRSLTPLVPSLAVEVLLERLDGLVLIKILLDLGSEVFRCKSALLVPAEPLQAICPLKELDHDVPCLLGLVVGDVVELKLTTVLT